MQNEPNLSVRLSGGRNRTRTCDPIDVNDVLYQSVLFNQPFVSPILSIFYYSGSEQESQLHEQPAFLLQSSCQVIGNFTSMLPDPLFATFCVDNAFALIATAR